MKLYSLFSSTIAINQEFIILEGAPYNIMNSCVNFIKGMLLRGAALDFDISVTN